ncbi:MULTISPECIES: metal ABC transporter solute-binding protein, Zn/Mn family [unclassified Acinetobacter]|uniref:metal ABC transporter solute-binding protein, Zn/Mn family n=1 Tax=unclassified Acinetobacter TaxID=196816 RepID=UPI0035BAC6B7
MSQQKLSFAKKVLTATIGLGLTSILATTAAYAKDFVVSTQTLYLIAKEVTKGVEEPVLLINSHDTGHDAQLTPKARQAMQDAKQILWYGKQYEESLASTLGKDKKAIAIYDYNLVHRLPERDVNGKPIANTLDPHVWLDPMNASRIAFFIANLRGQQLPAQKQKLQENARNFSKRMADASRANANNREQPYWAYHDAYQYLERSLNLKYAGGLTADHHLAPTAAQIVNLNKSRPKPNMCLLAEYDADSSLQQKLAPVKMMRVDEAMSKETDFVQGWINLANTVKNCTQ